MNKNKKLPSRSFSEKINNNIPIALGALTALTSLGAQAAVINVTGAAVSLDMASAEGSIAQWDVDGIGGSDFRLFRSFYSSSTVQNIQFASDDSNGRGLIAPSSSRDDVQALAQSFSVGPTLTNYAWGSGSYPYRNAMSNYGSGNNIGYDWNFDFAEGDNFFGFRFLNGADMHYGVGVINFDTVEGIVTIDRWAYNDTADEAVHVSAIPEPAMGALLLLGLGAGGVRAWRSRKKEQYVAA
ncbi:MAG: PEP-CTERM sorting domain-containing protein [Methyloprofundus sp.]|nr:PEP-CTERM sorting domain-containing protein [Methyloprofundus sp.]